MIFAEVKVVGYTQWDPDFNIPENATAEDIIPFTARVSNPENQNNIMTGAKLLKYLVKHAHWSPLEMAHVLMEIETTRDISRQILRHRSFAFQEFSQRYADPTQSLGFTNREARLQDPKNRQNSIDVEDLNLQQEWLRIQEYIIEESLRGYRWAIDNGIAKEQARALFPEGLVKTKMYMSGSLRSWIHFCALRGSNGTQKEAMKIAHLCWNEIEKRYPSLCGIVSTTKE